MKKKINNNVQKDEERKREKNARRRKSLLFGWWCEKEWIDENENVVLHLIMIRETFCTKIIYI